MVMPAWRLFSFPIRWALLAVAVLIVFGVWMPTWMQGSMFTAGLEPTIRQFGIVSAAVTAGISIVAGLHRYWQLRRWEQGAGRYCGRCAGMVVDRMSHRRLYQECIHCGRRFQF